MIIDIEKLTVKLGKQKVLDEASFRFTGGSIGLLGPNGAGKTTLIRVLLGFIRPLGGGGTVLDLDIQKDQLVLRQQVGYMPENDCHIPGMTAVSFVGYAGQLAGMAPKDAMQRAHEILYYVGLGEARYRKVETYSAGMKQRIKLAQALVHDPKLILLDEPTNGLDPKGRLEMLNLIREISTSKGIHVVLSSHLLPDVEWVCSDAVVIDKGRTLAAGKIEELKRPAEAMFECRIKGDRTGYIQRLAAAGCRCVEGEDDVIKIRLPDTQGSRLPLPPTQPLVYADIIGNEHAKRAAEVALAGKHTITFIGTDEAEALADWCATYGGTAFWIKDCPCGNTRHIYKPCVCTTAQVMRYHRSKIVNTAIAADIVIQCSAPGTDQVMRNLHGQRGEAEGVVLDRANYAQAFRPRILDHLDTPSDLLLRSFVAQIHPSIRRIKQMRQVAVTIAALAHSDHIETPHLAEALQYYMHGGW